MRTPSVALRSRLLFVVGFGLLASMAAAIYILRTWFRRGDHMAFAEAVTPIIFGLPTIFFAIAALVASMRSAAASEAMVVAADAQAEAARSQVKAANAQAATAEAQTRIIEAQSREAIRPILQIRQADFPEDFTMSSPLPPIEIFNAGKGAARDIRLVRSFDAEIGEVTFLKLGGAVVPPGMAINLPQVEEDEDLHETAFIMVVYESVAGHRCSSILRRSDGEEFLSYEDDPVITDPMFGQS